MKEWAPRKTIPQERGSKKVNNGPDAFAKTKRFLEMSVLAPKKASASPSGYEFTTMSLEDGRPARILVPVVIEPTPMFSGHQGVPRGGGTSKEAIRRAKRNQRSRN